MERLAIRFLFLGCLLLCVAMDMRLSWAGELGAEQFGQGLIKPWYLKPALGEKVDEMVGLLDPRASGFNDVVTFDTQQGHYRVYRGTVFRYASLVQARAQLPESSLRALLDVVLEGLVQGDKYYEGLRVGNYWRWPGQSMGLWIVQVRNPVIGHPVVTEVSPVTAADIEDWLASGRLKPALQ